MVSENIKSKSLLILLCLLFLCFFLKKSAFAATSPKKGAGETVQPPGVEYCGPNPTCLENYWNKINELGISWIYNWDCADWDGTGRPAWMTGTAIEYVPMIGGGGFENPKTYDETELNKFAKYARNRPGSSFLIWNEPDLIPSSVSIAASVYDSIRNKIKGADPSAKLIVGGVSFPNTGADGWLTRFRKAYKDTHNGDYPVVEGWAGHLYKSAENYDWRSWQEDLEKYHTWMDDIGDGSKEFWLTEFGSLTSNVVGMQIMNEQLAWLEEPDQSWITRYAWFEAGPSYDPKWNTYWRGNLFNNNVKDLTIDFSNLGARYASHPGVAPHFYQCPNYAQNCVLLDTACPNGKLYDQSGECGDDFKCCNPWMTPLPTSTPAPVPTATPARTAIPTATNTPFVTPDTFSRYYWNSNYPKSINSREFSKCISISSKSQGKWNSWIRQFLVPNTDISPLNYYYLKCHR